MYNPVNTAPSSSNHERPTTSLHARVATSLRNSVNSLRECPPEIWFNFVLKFLESYAYFALSQILVIFLHEEFGFSDVEAGLYYGMWGLAITCWGISLSYFNDKLGVRNSLLLGFSVSAIANLSLTFVSSKAGISFILFVILPIGNSMGNYLLYFPLPLFCKCAFPVLFISSFFDV